MTSRTMSSVVRITVCFFLVCNVNMAAEVTTTWDHSATLSITETLLNSNTETTLSTALDVTNITFSNTSSTTLNTSVTSQFSPSTTQNTVNVFGSSASKTNTTSTPTSLSSSSVPLTGSSASSNNQIYNTTASGVTRVLSTPPPTQVKPTPQSNGTETIPNGTTTPVVSEKDKSSMKYPEIILTSIFSAVLVVVVLVMLSFGFKRCLRSSQYSHHPLRETSYESDRYSPPDDTLVISGGLYDAPRIYNPNMTVLEEEEPQNDYTSFNSRQGQFRLEFLPGDKDMDPAFNESQRRNV
ncbi:uncharacterized protein ACMZJ9_000467 isoform 2-T3 [Mantella aurantiaca]